MKTLVIVFAVIIVVLLGILAFYNPAKGPVVPGAGSVSSTTSGLVQGIVLLSPTCPVVKNPPDPACAPKPYATSISISSDIENPQNAVLQTITSDVSGAFTVSLPAGEYSFKAQGGSVYPQCTEALVQVSAGGTATTTINCDTGIR